ncbi:MAG: 5-formyltetrahydrofolate cyclo-ligase [Clostridia bacterium]|nr:5-formyltetrahydrofolate cyclo-ligase [Clostridia bacterium]
MKDKLRKALKIKRENFRGEQRIKADRAIASSFLSAYGGYESYFVYNSFGGEADTSLIIKELLKAGKRVCIPRVEGDTMCAVPYTVGTQTKKGAFGIEEPQGQAYSGKLDVIIIPLLAVNPGGYRIGYGKGFYDKFLKGLNSVKIGLGYSFQQEEFINDEWDEPLDGFVSEKGITTFGK